MKAKHWPMLLLAGVTVLYPAVRPTPAAAQISVHIGIPLPLPFVFVAPPELIVLPGTNVYVAPDLSDDLYFEGGWWWRPWQGHWYRSRYHDRGWGYYSGVPSFYGSLNQGWRNDYRDHRWGGQPWNYERMPHDRVEKNWSTWRSGNYWRSHQSWGVEGYNPPQHHGSEAPQGHQWQTPQHHDHGGQQRDAMPSQRGGQEQQGSRRGDESRYGQGAPSGGRGQSGQDRGNRSQGQDQGNRGHGGGQGHDGGQQGHGGGQGHDGGQQGHGGGQGHDGGQQGHGGGQGHDGGSRH